METKHRKKKEKKIIRKKQEKGGNKSETSGKRREREGVKSYSVASLGSSSLGRDVAEEMETVFSRLKRLSELLLRISWSWKRLCIALQTLEREERRGGENLHSLGTFFSFFSSGFPFLKFFSPF